MSSTRCWPTCNALRASLATQARLLGIGPASRARLSLPDVADEGACDCHGILTCTNAWCPNGAEQLVQRRRWDAAAGER